MTNTAPPPPAVELAADAYPAGSRYANDDLRPVPLAERRWTTYNFVARAVGWTYAPTLQLYQGCALACPAFRQRN
ncbi:hypothetical protein AB0J38_30875 [Streptomyces sp. NPDC050095]|uniref:hypothetical protein n=1 Tax=unclassified Streptomyces TaxID=2593676 RepID=UPI003416A4F2